MGSKRGKDLDDLMLAYTDLSKKTRSSGFRGPPVKDLKTSNTKNANTFQTSNKSRDWSTFHMDLETAFLPNSQPISQPQPFVAQPQLLLQPQVNQPAFIQPQQPASLQPMQSQAASQEADEWGEFQDFSAPNQPLSLPQNPFTAVNPTPNLLPIVNPTTNFPPTVNQTTNLHPVSNLTTNFHPLLNANSSITQNAVPNILPTSNLPMPTKQVTNTATIEPTADLDEFEDFVSAPSVSIRPVSCIPSPKSSHNTSVFSLPVTKDLRQSEQFSEAIGSRLATFQDESPVHRFKTSPMPQATTVIDDDFGDFSLPTITSIPPVTAQPVSLLAQTPRSDSSIIPASDKYSAFRDFLETSEDGLATTSLNHSMLPSSPSPSADLLNTSADTLIALVPYKPPSDPFSLLSPSPSKQSPSISLNTSGDILLAPSVSNNDDFGDFAGFESNSSSANFGPIGTSTNPFITKTQSLESPDDEWSLPGGGPPPFPDVNPPVGRQHSPAWISNSPPPTEYPPATKSSGKMSHLDVEDFSLPSDQIQLSDRELFGTRLFEEPEKMTTASSQDIHNIHLPAKTNPMEDLCITTETENEFDKCPSRDKSCSPDSVLSSLPVRGKSSETQSVASLEFESPGESKSRHGSIVSLELSEVRNGGEDLESPYNEWTLTLAEISILIDSVVEIYNNTQADVKLELAESEKGQTYLSNLLEVYKVYQRIATSVKYNGKQGTSETWLKNQCDHIEESWSHLLQNVPTTGVLSKPETTAMSSASASSTCSLCLLDVGAKGTEPKLWYAGKEYHSGCANFWVNCVDSGLPSLTI